MKFLVKIKTKDGLSVKFGRFNTNEERNEWLRSSGFYESSGIYRHLDGRTAGIVTHDVGQFAIAIACHKPMTKGRVFRYG